MYEQIVNETARKNNDRIFFSKKHDHSEGCDNFLLSDFEWFMTKSQFCPKDRNEAMREWFKLREAEGRTCEAKPSILESGTKPLRPKAVSSHFESSSCKEGRRLAEGQYSEAEGRSVGRPKAVAPDLVLESEGLPSVLSNIEQVGKHVRHKVSAKSVQMCENKKHSFAFWAKKNPLSIHFTNFKCKSWRCPTCAPKVQHRDFSRIKKALDSNPGHWMFIVLTFNPKKYDGKKNAYVSIKENTHELLRKLRNDFGHVQYIQSVEQHQNGWPHINMLLKFSKNTVVDNEGCKNFRDRWLVKNALACGFGKMVSCEIAEGDGSKVANYIAKTGLAVVGEVSKISQVPVSAPIGTRRIRASKGLLPKIEKSDEMTGFIIHASTEQIEKTEQATVIEVMSQRFPELAHAESVTFTSTDKTKLLEFAKSIDDLDEIPDTVFTPRTKSVGDFFLNDFQKVAS